MPARKTSVNQPLYSILLKRLRKRDVLPLNSEEALAYWVTVLQRDAAEGEFGTNSDPIEEAPALMALKNHKRLARVDLLKDNPQNIMNERWTQFELRNNLAPRGQEV
jgi:hypothetical protein